MPDLFLSISVAVLIAYIVTLNSRVDDLVEDAAKTAAELMRARAAAAARAYGQRHPPDSDSRLNSYAIEAEINRLPIEE